MKKLDIDGMIDKLYPSTKKDKDASNLILETVDKVLKEYSGYEFKINTAELEQEDKMRSKDIAWHAGITPTNRNKIPDYSNDETNSTIGGGLALKPLPLGMNEADGTMLGSDIEQNNKDIKQSNLKIKSDLISAHREDVIKTINASKLKLKAFPSNSPNFINVIINSSSKEEFDQILNSLKTALQNKKLKGKLNKYNIGMRAPKSTPDQEKIVVASNTQDPNLSVYVFLNVDVASVKREDILKIILDDFKNILIDQKLINSQNTTDNPQGEYVNLLDSSDIKFQQNKDFKISRDEFNNKCFNLFISFLNSKKKEIPGFKYLKFNSEPMYDSKSKSPYVKIEALQYWDIKKQIKVYFKPIRSNVDYEKFFVDKVLGALNDDSISVEQAGNILVKNKPESGGIEINITDSLNNNISQNINNVVRFSKVDQKVGVSGGAPKSDLVFRVKGGDDSSNFWISFKHGNEASEAQQWGGISAYIGGQEDYKNTKNDNQEDLDEAYLDFIQEVRQRRKKSSKEQTKLKYVPESEDVVTVKKFVENLSNFLKNVGAVDPENPNVPDFSRLSNEHKNDPSFMDVVWKELDITNPVEKRIANNAIFGYNYGKEKGIDNVNALIKGTIDDIILEKIKNDSGEISFQLKVNKPGFILLNTEDALERLVSYNKSYSPMIYARGGDRNDGGIQNCRIAIYPLGYRKITSAGSLQENNKFGKIKLKFK
jgi:hypothetical protein